MSDNLDAYYWADNQDTWGDSNDPLQTGVPGLSGDSQQQINYAFPQPVINFLKNTVYQILNVTLNAASLNALESYVAQGVTLYQIAVAYAECDQSYYNDYNTYETVLGAAPTTSQAYAVASLEINNGYTLQNIRTLLVNSQTNINDLQFIYGNALNRSAAAQEIATQQQSQINGASITQVIASIATSQEALNDYGAIYQQVFSRAPSATDYQFAEGLIEKGTTLNSLRTALANSAESSTNLNNAYLAELGRAIDPSGLANFQSQLAAGTSLSTIKTEIADGQEAVTAISTVFQNILNRAPSASDLSAWQNDFANGGSLAGLRTTAAYSQEAANDIAAYFQRILGRPPSASDLAAWQQNFANGGSLAGLATAAAYSPEAQNIVNQYYENVDGRAVDPSGLASCQNELASGTSLTTLLSQLAYSPETASHINQDYENVDGRAVDPSGLASCQNELATGYNLTTILSQLAYSPELAGDLQVAMRSIEKIVDNPTFSVIEQSLASGGNLLQTVATILNSTDVQSGFAKDFEQLLGREPTAQELSSETTEFTQKIDSVNSPTWTNLAATIGNAAISFLSEANPIGTAEAAGAKTSQAQQIANRTKAQSLLSNSNVLAFMKAISAVENFGQYSSQNYYYQYGDAQGSPSSTAADLTSAFPAGAASSTNSAAGAYALTHATYHAYQGMLGLSDFSPNSQDLIAVYNFSTTHGTTALLHDAVPTAADFNAAVYDAAHQWQAVAGGPSSPFGIETSVIGLPAHQTAPYTYEQFVSLYKSFGGTGTGF